MSVEMASEERNTERASSATARGAEDITIDLQQLALGATGSITWPRKVQPDTPLSSHEHIRLLHIDSISDDTLACSLWEYPPLPASNLKYSYCALSYCWGDGPCDQTITINDEPVLITGNLLGALKDVHSFWQRPNAMAMFISHLEHELLWADAICLNQDNDEEKSVQIQRMGEIFTGAERVLIWLGHGIGDVSPAMLVCQWLEARIPLKNVEEWLGTLSEKECEETLKMLTDRLASCTLMLTENYGIDQHLIHAFEDFCETLEPYSRNEIAKLTGAQISDLTKDLHSTQNPFSTDGSFWVGFFSLMNQPWFTRIWTLQEVLLAREASIIYCGQCADWYPVRVMRRLFFTASWKGPLYSKYRTLNMLSESARLSFNSAWNDFNNPSTRHLNSVGRLQFLMIQNSGFRQARDPRDCVYGLLGLLDPDLRKELRADYRLSTASVFSNVVKVVSEEQDAKHLLRPLIRFLEVSPFEDTSESDLPSWCPNFGSVGFRYNHDFFTSKTSKRKLQHEQLSPPTMPRITKHMTMQASVILLDEIKYAVNISPPGDVYEKLRRKSRHRNFWRKWRRTHPQACQTWFSSMFDLTHHSEVKTSTEKVQWLRAAIWGDHHTYFSEEMVLETFRTGVENKATPKDGEQGTSMEWTGPPFLDPKCGIRIKCFGKYFLLTKEGQIGFGARPVKAGDKLCYIPGGGFLQVLSSDCDRYITPVRIHELEKSSLLGLTGSEPVWTEVTLF